MTDSMDQAAAKELHIYEVEIPWHTANKLVMDEAKSCGGKKYVPEDEDVYYELEVDYGLLNSLWDCAPDKCKEEFEEQIIEGWLDSAVGNKERTERLTSWVSEEHCNDVGEFLREVLNPFSVSDCESLRDALTDAGFGRMLK